MALMSIFTTTEPASLAAGAVNPTQPASGDQDAMSEKTTIVFRKLRDTKNTVRFEEEVPPGKPPVIGTIYVQKWFARDTQELAITIEKEGN